MKIKNIILVCLTFLVVLSTIAIADTQVTNETHMMDYEETQAMNAVCAGGDTECTIGDVYFLIENQSSLLIPPGEGYYTKYNCQISSKGDYPIDLNECWQTLANESDIADHNCSQDYSGWYYCTNEPDLGVGNNSCEDMAEAKDGMWHTPPWNIDWGNLQNTSYSVGYMLPFGATNVTANPIYLVVEYGNQSANHEQTFTIPRNCVLSGEGWYVAINAKKVEGEDILKINCRQRVGGVYSDHLIASTSGEVYLSEMSIVWDGTQLVDSPYTEYDGLTGWDITYTWDCVDGGQNTDISSNLTYILIAFGVACVILSAIIIVIIVTKGTIDVSSVIITIMLMAIGFIILASLLVTIITNGMG